MKKLILSIAISILSLPTFAQSKIVMDKVDQSGARFIGTDDEVLRNGMMDKHPICFSLLYSSDGENESIDLMITMYSITSVSMPKGGILLIKTGSGNVIELKQNRNELDTKDVVGTYNAYTKAKTYRACASYSITKDQLRSISTDGIEKLRLETSIENIDQIYKSSRIEKSKSIFSNQLDLLNEAINKSGKDDIRDGF